MPRGKAGLRDMQNMFKSIRALLYLTKKHLTQVRFHDSALLDLNACPSPSSLDTAGELDNFLSSFIVNMFTWQ